MKTCFTFLGVALAVACAVGVAPVTGRAQDDSVRINAAELQRLVYASHLLTQIDEKPELEASLVVLLGLQRRNPQADPMALADLSRQALERYRLHAPGYLRTIGSRDEILAAYLETLSRLPAQANFTPATLSLVNILMGRPDRNPPPTTSTPAELIHAGNQRMVAAADELARRQELVDECTRRAWANAAFGRALEGVLLLETGVSLAQTSARVLSANSALNDSPTMRELLRLSLASGDGGVTISTNLLKSLFSMEMETLHRIVATNSALHLEILATQTDLPSYLTNTALIAANLQREAAIHQGQPQRLAAASAAVNALAQLTTSKLPAVGEAMNGLGRGVKSLADGVTALGKGWSAAGKLGQAAACGNFVAAGFQVIGALLRIAGIFQDPNDAILKEIGQVKTLIKDLSTNLDYRFDQVDLALNQVLGQLSYSIDLIGGVGHDVDQVRQGLLEVQRDLHRLERQLFTYFNTAQRHDLELAINGALYYATYNPSPMSYATYSQIPDGPENTFYTYATTFARNDLSSPVTFSVQDLSDANLELQFAARPLDANLNYLRKVLYRLASLPAFGPTSPVLANPRDWFVSASAYQQLALENPMHFRSKGRLDAIIARGQEIEGFCQDLVFTTSGPSPQVNYALYNTLLTNYSAKLSGFVSQVRATELARANLDHFALDTWRQWSAAAPRLTAAGSALLGSDPSVPLISLPAQVTEIAAGGAHNLALKNDGTVVSWGSNDHGQTTIPEDATNGIAIAAGASHSLALRADGTVIAWGAGGTDTGVVPDVGQCLVPDTATDAIAISAGRYHSLALRTGGEVIGWGYGVYGQTTTPLEATNVVAIVAGGLHSLALREDRTVVGWGLNHLGQTTIPEDATNVVALAAGGDHSLALRGDGTLVAWGDNANGQTTIPNSATNVVAIAAGDHHCLALKADGTVVGWGQNADGQINIPPSAIRVRELAAGLWHSMALKADGSVVAWGAQGSGQCSVPALPTWQKAISAGGGYHVLALRTDGRVRAWGDNSYSQIETPANLTNAVAVAAGSGGFSLALRADGSVLGWGRNDIGQTTIPASATNVIAIAAGLEHGLAARADGTVVGWGNNSQGQRTVPASATNVIAVAAGNLHSLALRADGTVVGWGYNAYGQISIPPSASSNVVAIVAGTHHSLALKTDGTVVGWGYNNHGRSPVPGGLDDVVAIAGSTYGSMAVKADGAVVAWGDTSLWDWAQGQTDLSAVPHRAPANATTNQFQTTLHGAVPVPNSTPLTGYALSFDGINDYVRIEDAAQLDLTVNYTLECWFKAEGFGGLRGLIGKYHTPGANGYLLRLTDNNLDFEQMNTTDLNLQAGVWYHVAAVNSNGTRRLYLDGLEQTLTSTGSYTVQVNTDPLCLGVDYLSDPGRFFSGQMDEVRIWNVARTQTEIQADLNQPLSGTEPGLVAYWRFDEEPLPPPSDVIRIAAGRCHSLVLQTDGTVAGFGDNRYQQCAVPASATNAIAVAAGDWHSLALKADGRIVSWGYNADGRTNPPANATDLVAVAAGGGHTLALKRNGTVVGWGANNYGQTNVPAFLDRVVAMAAGGSHSLALKADGTVIGWGNNDHGQTNTTGLNNVVAIAAGANHSLALLDNGQVVAWGLGNMGQTSVPPEAQSGVVAIAAGQFHNLALKQDGTVVSWGGQGVSLFTVPGGLSNVVTIAAGGWHSLFLTARSSSEGGPADGLTLVRADIPERVLDGLREISAEVRGELDQAGDLNTAAVNLSGAKALLEAVLALGMPYTLERDDVLHGFLCGNEALTDLEVARALFTAETNKLATTPELRPMILGEVVWARLTCFTDRLQNRLDDLTTTGQPETPRLVGQTLRLLGLLRDASAVVPPPALEIAREPGTLELVAYGEPCVRYTLQESDNLEAWFDTIFTNVHNERPLVPPHTTAPRRFYRTVLPSASPTPRP